MDSIRLRRPSRYGSRSIIAVLAALVLLLLPVSASLQESALPQTPEQYEEYVLNHHPLLKAQRELSRAANNEAEAARTAVPQPQISYNLGWGNWGAGTGENRHMVMLSQRIPWPGVLALHATPAERSIEVISARQNALKLDLVYRLRKSLIEVAELQESMALLQEQLEVHEEVISLIEQTIAYGERDFADLLRVNLAAQLLSDRHDVLSSQYAQTLAGLRELLGVAPSTSLEFDDALLSSVLHLSHDIPALESLLESVQRRHPELKMHEAESDVAKALGEVARARNKPWPTISLGYELMPMAHGERQHIGLLGFSVPIPIFGKQYTTDVDRYLALSAAHHLQHTYAYRQQAQEVEASLERFSELARRLNRYEKELLPMAGDITERLLAEIEVGQRSVTDYLLTFNQQLELQMTIIALRASIAGERARLYKLSAWELGEDFYRGTFFNNSSHHTEGGSDAR